MKRSILIVLFGIFIVGLSYSQAFAKEESLPLTATASSEYSSYYSPDKAVDGSDSTFWIGAIDAAPWWITFDAGAINQIDRINIKWYHSYYATQDYDIQISSDASNWENIFTGISGTYDSEGETREIGREARYIRLYINTVARYFPVLREFEAYTKMNLPRLIRFQARLGDAEEVPLDGTFTLTFRLYDTDTGGVPIWEEVQQNVFVEEGILDVELGSVTALELPFDRQYWLGVEVESDGEMTPRFKFTAVPYSFMSER